MRKTTIIAAALTALSLLAACSSGPPSASDLLLKVPGCHAPTVDTPDPNAVQQTDCTTPWATVTLATFSSQQAEMAWIRDEASWGGSCCLQGDSWAALVNNSGTVDGFAVVTKAIGGRQVTPPGA